MGLKMVIALTMMDLVQDEFDVEKSKRNLEFLYALSKEI